MSTPEQPPVDPAVTRCLLETVLTTRIPDMLPLGQGVEQRYLGSEFNSDGALLASSIAAYEILEEVGAAAELPPEKVAAAQEASQTARRMFGTQVIALAADHKLVETMDSDELRDRLLRRFPHPRLSFEDGSESDYSRWGIYEGTRHQPLLAHLASTYKGVSAEATRFSVVSLDRLYSLAPEPLTTLIRDYHILSARAMALHSVSYTHNLHTIEPSQIVPDFIAAISDITYPNSEVGDTEKQAGERLAIGTFLQWLIAIDYDYDHGNRVWSLVQEYRAGGSTVTMSSGARVSMNTYLEHVTDCPTQTPKDRVHAEEQLEFSRSLADTEVNLNLLEGSLQYPDLYRYPAVRFANIVPNTKRLRQEIDGQNSATSFMQKHAETPAWSDMISDLAEAWPEGEVLWQALRSELHSVDGAGDPLEKLIRESANKLRFMWGIPNRSKVSERIASELRFRLQPRPLGSDLEQSGVTPVVSRSFRGDVSISDKRLASLLELAVLKKAIATIKDNPQQADNYKILVTELVEDSVARLEDKKQFAIKTVDMHQEAVRFKELAGITDQELQEIFNAAKIHDSANRTPLRDTVYHGDYTTLFNALLLHKLKAVNLKSLVFQGLIKTLLNKPDMDLTALAEIVTP